MTEPVATTRYHYVITVQCPIADIPGALWMNTGSGTLDIPPGMTRTRAFEFILNQQAELARRQGCTDPKPNVLFWSLEPDVPPAGGTR